MLVRIKKLDRFANNDFLFQMTSTSAFMMPSTSSDLNSWIARSQISSSDPPLPAMIDPSTNPEYRRQRDNCFSIFDEFTEDEQVLDQCFLQTIYGPTKSLIWSIKTKLVKNVSRNHWTLRFVEQIWSKIVCSIILLIAGGHFMVHGLEKLGNTEFDHCWSNWFHYRLSKLKWGIFSEMFV